MFVEKILADSGQDAYKKQVARLKNKQTNKKQQNKQTKTKNKQTQDIVFGSIRVIWSNITRFAHKYATSPSIYILLKKFSAVYINR